MMSVAYDESDGVPHQSFYRMEGREMDQQEKHPLILLYGETDGLLNILSEIFTQKGYGVCIATDNEKLVTSLDTKSPDVLIFDIGEFNEGILQSIDLIRSQSGIPIIILSSHSTTMMPQNILAKGVSGFVVKPFRFNELMVRVEAKLKQRQVN